MKDEKKRLFVSIELPDSVLAEIERIQRELKKANLFEGRYTQLVQLHITPKFIGEVDADQIEAIKKALHTITLEPCQAQLGGVDVFVKRDRIKIIYLAIISPGLEQFAQKLNQVLQPWSESNKRAFVSHITLAQVKNVEDNQRLLGLLRKIKVNPIKFTINTFTLKESELKSEGPEHRVVKKY